MGTLLLKCRLCSCRNSRETELSRHFIQLLGENGILILKTTEAFDEFENEEVRKKNEREGRALMLVSYDSVAKPARHFAMQIQIFQCL